MVVVVVVVAICVGSAAMQSLRALEAHLAPAWETGRISNSSLDLELQGHITHITWAGRLQDSGTAGFRRLQFGVSGT